MAALRQQMDDREKQSWRELSDLQVADLVDSTDPYTPQSTDNISPY